MKSDLLRTVLTTYFLGAILVTIVMAEDNRSTTTDSISIQKLLQNAEHLHWDLSVDSAVNYLTHLGLTDCRIIDRNNHCTVGPCVDCRGNDKKVGIAYTWHTIGGVHFVPVLSFYTIDFPECRSCMNAFISLKDLGYTKPDRTDPIELDMIIKTVHDTLQRKIQVEVWNECCPGNRLKLYRSIFDN